MNILMIWAISTVTSFFLELANEFRMFKDVADAGYKVDIEKLSEFNKRVNPDATKATLFTMLIPLVNIIDVFRRIAQYDNARPMILDQLNVIDVLEEMSDAEKAEYTKKPTGLNAVLVPLKLEYKLANASSIEVSDENGDGKIYYSFGNSLDDIKIIKASGSASKLSVAEQKKQVLDARKEFSQIEEDGYKELFVRPIDSTDSLEETKEEKTISKNSRDKQKQTLEELKKELLKDEKTGHNTSNDNGSSFSKRKK